MKTYVNYKRRTNWKDVLISTIAGAASVLIFDALVTWYDGLFYIASILFVSCGTGWMLWWITEDWRRR